MNHLVVVFGKFLLELVHFTRLQLLRRIDMLDNFVESLIGGAKSNLIPDLFKVIAFLYVQNSFISTGIFASYCL
jgi:hypothetical protein